MTREGECGTKTLADWAYVAIEKHFQKILKHEAGVLRDEDPEELHQMRVGTRRLRATLSGFAPALKLSKVARPDRVGKIAGTLGKLRDLDVLKEALSGYLEILLSKKEQKSLREALKVLESQRERRFTEVSRLLKSSDYEDCKRAFQDWLEKPTYQPIGHLAIETVLPDLLLPQISAFLLHEGWLIGVDLGGNKDRSDRTPADIDRLLKKEGVLLHDLRKEAKRSRYNMELFSHFYEQQYQKHLDDIKAIQEVLGEIQDFHILAEFLTSVFENSLEKEMPALVEIFQKNRYEKWMEWRPLQRKYLDANTRKSLHEALLNPVFEKNSVESDN